MDFENAVQLFNLIFCVDFENAGQLFNLMFCVDFENAVQLFNLIFVWMISLVFSYQQYFSKLFTAIRMLLERLSISLA